jgi:phosphate transport system substrate-binding protein
LRVVPQRLRLAFALAAAFVGLVAGSPAQAQTVLHGAGATFPAPVYKKWFDSYSKNHPDVQVVYDAVGSEAGIQLLSEGKVDFAASDMPLSDEKLAQLGGKVTHFATVLGAVVPIYNVSGQRKDLNFTPEILAGIYLGKIKKWNDPSIRSANHGAPLPDAAIVVVHRNEGSGTSFVWTDYLSRVSADWKTQAGSGATVSWPVGTGAEGNEGVAAAVQNTPNAIGYVELIYAIQHKLGIGAVKNAAGQFVQANISSVTAAAEDLKFDGSDFRVSIANASRKEAYPIATFTWLLVPQASSDPKKRETQLAVLRWMLSSGQKQCSALGYAPLPASVTESELRALDKLQ